MFENAHKVLSTLPSNAKCALTSVLNVLTTDLCPEMSSIKKCLRLIQDTHQADVNLSKKLNSLECTFSLCCSQIVKCVILLVEIFKKESEKSTELPDSRKWVVERFKWCIKRLSSVAVQMDHLDKFKDVDNSLSLDEEHSLFEIPLHFVNWIDHTFTLLEQLTGILLKTDSSDNYKEVEYTELWKNEVSELLSSLHLGVDELLMSAMTLCRCCLPEDQQIITVRSQVVLRETKSFMKELLLTENNDTYKISSENLRIPLHPSTISVLIDILKESLYTLETNTNTALLSLLVNCFVDSSDPVEKMKIHFKEKTKSDPELSAKVGCTCPGNTEETWDKNCEVVKTFDFYCECLTQIGLFAMSCSSDDKRMLSLRSGLASLEALDPHLVPALIMSPHSDHTEFLEDNWRKDIKEIRNSVFLIVDPVAFIQRAKEIMHTNLLNIKKHSFIKAETLPYVINLGKLVLDFLNIYQSMEPDALLEIQPLVVLLDNLNKVVNECFAASVYFQTTTELGLSFERIFKRLKLLYTLVTRIYQNLNNCDNDKSQNIILEDDENLPPITNDKNRQISVTCDKAIVGSTTQILDKNHTNEFKINLKNSVLMRSTIINHSKRAKPSPFLTMKLKECLYRKNTNDELDFSFQIDNILNSEDNQIKSSKNIDKNVSNSVLYVLKRKMSTRMSLRKEILRKRAGSFSYSKCVESIAEMTQNNTLLGSESTMNLQITEILDQLMDLSTTSVTKTASKRNKMTKTIVNINIDDSETSENNHIISRDIDSTKNILLLPVNGGNAFSQTEKDIWKIKIRQNPIEESFIRQPVLKLSSFCMNLTNSSSVQTLQSTITTPERMNDLEALDKKLASLKGTDL